MKALSLWEPFASLIALQAKRFETRSWATSYRGPLLICAAKGGLPNYRIEDLLGIPEFQFALEPLVAPNLPGTISVSHLQFGKALCIVKLMRCFSTSPPGNRKLAWYKEEEFGDFSPGRFAWELQFSGRFKTPWPIRGKQGIFDVPDELIAEHELEAA